MAFKVARGWGWDPVPPREEPGEQDAGDLKGHPIRPSSTLSLTEYPTPFREGDAYWDRSIGCGRDKSAPTLRLLASNG